MADVTKFINDNGGWWSILALPLGVAALVAAIVQVVIAVRTANLSPSDRWLALKTTIRRSRLPLRHHERDLIGGTYFPARIVDREDRNVPHPLDHFRGLLVDGKSFHVVGVAGAGKTTLALELRRQVAGDPDADYAVDVLQARDWDKGTAGWVAARSIAQWAARELGRRYRAFGERYLRDLILQGRLLLVIDGLDELKGELRDNFDKALAIHALSLPIIVFRRETPGSSIQLDDAVAQLFSAPTFSVLPWTEVAASRVLRERVGWFSELAESRNMPEIKELLTNPLRLQIVMKTWGDSASAADLTDSANPERTLWERFAERFVDSSPLTAHWAEFPQFVRAIALLSYRSSSGFALHSALYSRHSESVARLVSGGVVLLLGYSRDTPVTGAVVALAIVVGLKGSYPKPYVVVRRRFGIVAARIGLSLGLTCFYLSILVLRSWLDDLLSLLYYDDQGVPWALWHKILVGSVFKAYWDEYGWPSLVNALSPLHVLYAANLSMVLQLVAMADLQSPRGDVLIDFTPRVLRRYSVPIRIALAALLVIDLLYPAPVVLWILLVSSFATCTYLLVATCLVCKYVGTSPLKFVRLARSLSVTGIAEYRRGVVRFMHDEVADVLAKQALAEGSRDSKAHRLVRPTKYMDMLDTRVRPEAIGWIKPSLVEFGRDFPRNDLLLWYRCRYSLYVSGDLAEANSALRYNKHALQSPYGKAALAEVLWCSGKRDEAKVQWARIQGFERTGLVANTFAQVLAIDGRYSDGVDSLRTFLKEVPANRFALTGLAELLLRYGGPQDEREARSILTKIRNERGYRDYRCILELARLASEVDADEARSLEVLEPYLGSASWNCDDLAAARTAQIYSRLGDTESAIQYSEIALLNRDWAYDPIAQLEILLTGAVILNDATAAAMCNNILSFGWRIGGRPTFAAWVRAETNSPGLRGALESI